MTLFKRTATPQERLELLLAAALRTGDELELAHIAQHVGMGSNMEMLRGVSADAIRGFFGRMSVARQLKILEETEACEW